MAVADRHQPLADIGAGRDRHAQAVGGVLVDEAPVGAHQEAALRLAHAVEIAKRAVAHAVGDRAGGRHHPGRDAVEQRRLARAGLADHGQHLARPQLEGDILAADARAIEFGERIDAEKGFVDRLAHRVRSVGAGLPSPSWGGWPEGPGGGVSEGGAPVPPPAPAARPPHKGEVGVLAISPRMPFVPALLAKIGVGADEHLAAAVVEDHLVEIDLLCTAQRAGLVEGLDLEGMILEVEADDLGEGRDGVDALLAAGAEELQGRRPVHLRVVEFRRRRRIHHVAPLDLDRIGIGGGDAAMPGDVLVELHMHQSVFFERMHLARLGFARLEEAQRLGDRHLVDKRLALGQRVLGDAVARLDDGRLGRVGGHLDIGDLDEEGADRDGIGGVVGALVDDLEHIVRADDRRGDLHAAGAPAIGHRHFARRERYLVAGDGDALQDRAADHPLGLLVEIGKVVGGDALIVHDHSAASFASALAEASPAECSARMRRTRSSSAWKST